MVLQKDMKYSAHGLSINIATIDGGSPNWLPTVMSDLSHDRRPVADNRMCVTGKAISTTHLLPDRLAGEAA